MTFLLGSEEWVGVLQVDRGWRSIWSRAKEASHSWAWLEPRVEVGGQVEGDHVVSEKPGRRDPDSLSLPGERYFSAIWCKKQNQDSNQLKQDVLPHITGSWGVRQVPGLVSYAFSYVGEGWVCHPGLSLPPAWGCFFSQLAGAGLRPHCTSSFMFGRGETDLLWVFFVMSGNFL